MEKSSYSSLFISNLFDINLVERSGCEKKKTKKNINIIFLFLISIYMRSKQLLCTSGCFRLTSTVYIIAVGFGLWCFTQISTIFQLYSGG